MEVTSGRPSTRITLPDAFGLLDPAGQDEAPHSEVRRLVPLACVPWLVVTHEQLVTLPLDSRAAFVLSLVDGRCSVEMIVDMSGMPQDQVLEILGRLVALQAIELHDR